MKLFTSSTFSFIDSHYYHSGATIMMMIIIFSIFLSLSCNKPSPVEPTPVEFSINSEGISCIEAWLNIKVNREGELKLFRNDSLVCQLSISTGDSLLVDDGLLPNQIYRYRAEYKAGLSTYSKEIEIKTMGTTGSNFTFQKWTFGDIGTSRLHDIVILDENNIWAVGEIEMADTNILGYTTYNAVHWNGIEWTLKKIPFTGDCSTVIYPAITSVLAFGDSDIWFSRGGSLVHFDGNNYFNDCRMHYYLTGSINRIMGLHNNDFYAVGNKGNIIHYLNGNWSKLNSGTILPIYNIFGTRNSENEENEILCVANSWGYPDGSRLLSIKGETVKEVWNDSLPYGLHATWFIPNRKYIVVGDGLWEKRVPDKNWTRQSILPALSKTTIAGQGLNDIFVGGAYWLLAHWNGVNWQTYFPSTSGCIGVVKMKDDFIVLIGYVDREAVIMIGRR